LKQKKNEKTTPRIVGVATNDMLVLGLADERRKGLKTFQANPGRAYYISTYQLQNIGEHSVEDFGRQCA